MEHAIRKSIEGGYEIKSYNGLGFGIDGRVNHIKGGLNSSGEILLDPEFWKCLGKQQGWEKWVCPKCFLEVGQCDENRIEKWHLYWVCFIDHLAEGKSIDDFFNNLLH